MALSYSFKGQVVLVTQLTGGSSGIGAETAVHFAEAGCEGLVLVGRDEGRLEEVKDRCTAKGIEKSMILLIQEDMTKEGGPQRIMKAVDEKFGKLHILVNNAGIGGLSSLSDPELMEKYDKIYALNLRSTALLTQLAVPYLLKTKGNIVNVSSICAKVAVPNMLAYNITKAALDYFTESTARYMAPNQVRVNSVNPGSIMTPLHTRVGRSIDDVRELAKKIHPIGRIGESDEVAKTILFLASDDASFITGETISVDGGRFLLCP